MPCIQIPIERKSDNQFPFYDLFLIAVCLGFWRVLFLSNYPSLPASAAFLLSALPLFLSRLVQPSHRPDRAASPFRVNGSVRSGSVPPRGFLWRRPAVDRCLVMPPSCPSLTLLPAKFVQLPPPPFEAGCLVSFTFIWCAQPVSPLTTRPFPSLLSCSITVWRLLEHARKPILTIIYHYLTYRYR